MNTIYISHPGQYPPANNKAKSHLYSFLKKLGLPSAQHNLFISLDGLFMIIVE